MRVFLVEIKIVYGYVHFPVEENVILRDVNEY